MPEKWDNSEDHLEPVWKEGREYQLVCGLDIPLNKRLEATGFNSRKSNRFLPWRTFGVCPPPSEPGDLCWFLNPDTERWEFIPWLGDRWFELTRSTCAEHFAGVAGACREETFYINDKPLGSFKPGYLWYNNGQVNKRFLEGQTIPRGFTRGRLFTTIRNDNGQFERKS
jgi:hypothetical protein